METNRDNHQKTIDKNKNLKDNKFMDTITCKFVTAVFLVAKRLSEDKLRKTFSIYDITQALREAVNCGKIILSDRVCEIIDLRMTYYINHADVKSVFLELIDYEVITDIQWVSNGIYNEYSKKVIKPTEDKVETKSNPCRAEHLSVCIDHSSRVDRYNSKLIDKLDAFLAKQALCPSSVTLKRIQSAMKAPNISCREYYAILSKLGYIVNTNNPHPSNWIVNF